MQTQTRSVTMAILAFFLVSCVAFYLLFLRVPSVQADNGRELLQAALQQIQEGKPGQILHVSYTVYSRTPPADLEPIDPYHLPYAQIWPAKEIEETWLEIDERGKVTRWRTQLRSMDGELLQDLLFDGVMETDYFVKDGRAIQFPGEAADFRDERIALIQDFFQRAHLSRSENLSPDGSLVLSVYTESVDIQSSSQSQLSIEEALLNFSRPFIADLKPVSTTNRIDFDPATLLPVGTGQIVWDSLGAEHVVSYRTFSQPTILSVTDVDTKAIFRQEIPAEAFQNTFSLPAATQLTTFDQLTQQVHYPVYGLPESAPDWKLVSASFNPSMHGSAAPAFLRGIDLAASSGVGAQTIYTNHDNSATLFVVQGPTADIRHVLRQTMPTWLKSERIQLFLGDEQFPAWVLIGQENSRIRYVIEADDTIVYVDGRGVAAGQVVELLSQFIKANGTWPSWSMYGYSNKSATWAYSSGTAYATGNYQNCQYGHQYLNQSLHSFSDSAFGINDLYWLSSS